MLQTLREFVLRVEELDNVHDAYYVFEEEVSDTLRDEIYSLVPDSAEPFRAAMLKLGYADY